MKLVSAKAVLFFALLAIFAASTHSAGAYTWQDADIGAPTAAGSSTVNGTTITVNGAGTGDTYYGNDQLHYTYFTQVAGGNIDIIARISSFSGSANGHAGIMLRSGTNSPGDTTAEMSFAYHSASDGNNTMSIDAHDPTAPYVGQDSGVETRMALPIWIRLVRMGINFAIYKSPDGHMWSSLGNTSGWQFAPTGPIEVGFFTSSGSSSILSSATFDNIQIGTPAMGYSSSWYGNTAGGNVSDGHVSNGVSSMWTGPDGSCYTNSYYDEGGAEAVKLYKGGKVIKSFRQGNEMIGNSECGEGSITSDGTNVYLLAYGYEGNVLVKTDMLGDASATVPMWLSYNPFDSTRGLNTISGLAAANNEVYISDSVSNVIRVAQPTIPIYYQAGNTKVDWSSQTISTAGVANAAPASVYMTSRENDYLPFVIPGLTPSSTYTVRCHFAEYTETTTGKRLIDIGASGATSVIGYDVVAAAGGPFKPAVLDIPNAKSNASGVMNVTFSRSSLGGDGHLVICGFEILNPNGTDAFALNCGGPAVGAFQAETYDIPSRTFAFQRPGPMVVDSRGDLWIIQEANNFPVGTTITTQYPGAILCYHPNGTFTGKQITDVANPTAIAYDSVNDRLVIADNGPNQNVRFYSNLATTPSFSGTFGEQGGIFGSPNPGLIYNQTSGNYDRFYGLTGVGIDNNGVIYVASGMQGTDLRALNSDGSLSWMLEGLPFCTTPGLDPASDGTQAYSVYFHAALNYANNTPGSEWSYQSYDWNPTAYGSPPREGNAQAIMRRLGPAQSLFMYTSGQGSVDYCGIFRYNGEEIIPCGQISNSGGQIWIDSNGDGLQTSNEVTTLAAPGGLSRFCVDQNGDIWFALMGASSPILRHFKFMGINSIGAPIYDFNTGDYEDIPYPGIGTPISTWAQESDVRYDAQRDSMYLLGPAVNRTSGAQNVDSYLARYDGWSTGNRIPRWLIYLPDPATDYNFQYETGTSFQWMGMDVAADKLFIAGLWGNINVYNTHDGSLNMVMDPGPEIEGSDAWEDASMGVTAFKRQNGEFVVFSENSGFDGKTNMFRIPPSTVNIPPVVSLTSPHATDLLVIPTNVTLTAQAVDDDGSVGSVAFYNGTTLLATDTTAPYTYNWQNVPPGTYTLTAQATDNQGAVTTSAPVTINVLSHFPPTVNITSPFPTQYFTNNPPSVPIAAFASEVQGTIASVTFYNGSTPIGTMTSVPYSMTWTGMTPGTYTLTAVATDAYGQSVSSAPVSVTVISNASTNLFAGLSLGTVPSGPNGWTRNPVSDNQYDIITFTNTLGAPPSPPCMAVQAVGDSRFQYANRTLGTNSALPYWKISGQLLFAYYNPNDYRTQYRILVNDAAGNTIAMLDRLTWNWGDSSNYIQFNGQTVVPGTIADHSAVDALSDSWNAFSIEAYGGQVVLSYGGHVVATAPLSGSDLGSPTTLVIQCGYNCYAGQTVYLDSLAFTTQTIDQAPAVNLTAPSNGAVYSPAAATIALAATATSSTTASISRVNFSNGSTLLGTATTSPYQFTWSNVPSGDYALSATAYDNWNVQTTSSSVTVHVSNPPTVGMTVPSNNAVYAPGSTVALAASASADTVRSITSVAFYNGTTLLGTATSAPYSYNWTSVPIGNYTLTAIATDSVGVTTTSSPIAISVVQLTPPTTTDSLAGTKVGANYTTAVTVTLTENAVSPATVANTYFTVDGGSQTTYTAPFTVSSNGGHVITFWSVDSLGNTETTKSDSFTIAYPIAPTPTLSPASGSVAYGHTVTITDSVGGAAFYYTTNGTAPSVTSTPYTGPVVLTAGETIKAIATASGYSPSAAASGTFTVAAPTPTFSPAAGTVAPGTSVSILDGAPGAAIFYTTNGTTPTATSTPYAGAITVSVSQTIKAIAVATGCTNSAVASAAYTVAVPTPVISPAGGSGAPGRSVTITDTLGAAATIYYTTNGTTPNASSTPYTGAIIVSVNETIKAVAIDAGFTSATASDTFTVVTPTPTITPPGGTVVPGQLVTLSDSAAGTTIYYTTNGTAPTTSSTVYTGPITVSTSQEIEAIAVLPGCSSSSVAWHTFTAMPPTPTMSPAGGTVPYGQTVVLSDSIAGVAIYYTTNATAPTTSSALYTGPITVTMTQTIEAIAVLPGCSNSSTALHTFTAVVPTPTISPAAGSVPYGQSVTLTDLAAPTIIYYTTNGTSPTTASAQYTGPIVVTSNETVKALGVIAGCTTSAVAASAFTVPVTPTPTFSLRSGTYAYGASITISDTAATAAITYTTDGTAPTSASTPYTGAIVLTAGETVKALAVLTGDQPSAVATATYTVTAPAPTVSPLAGTYAPGQQVTLTDLAGAATIYYTTNGTTPTTASTAYTGAITLNATQTIKAIAVVAGDVNSGVLSTAYTIVVPTPAISPAAGALTLGQGVTLTDSAGAATIYYTTNGTTPTTSSTVYAAPIVLTANATVKAIGVIPGCTNSAVVSAAYTVH